MAAGMRFGKKYALSSAMGFGITLGVIGKAIFDRIKGQGNEDLLNEKAEHLLMSSELDDFVQKYGLPEPSPTLSYTYHVVGYDLMHKTPSWVVQRINKDILKGDANRKLCNFKRDLKIPKMFSANNEDYVNSEFTKGHLAPAADNRCSQQAMEETFLFTNIVPQNSQNNSGFWYKTERFCRKLAQKYSDVYVVSGPLYLPTETDQGKMFVKYQVIGESEVAVPSHLYKVILVEKNQVPFAIGAFIIPNLPISNAKTLDSFMFPLNYLEAKLGHQLFPNIKSKHFKCLCNVENCKLVK